MRRVQRVAAEILFEVALVIIFLKAYNLVRNQFGSQKCTPEYALGHATQVIWLEEVLGIFWEQQIQGMVIKFTHWIKFWNIFYGTAHMAVTVFVLGYLFALKPGAYQRCRTVFIVMNILAIAGYAAYPLMPPRLVPTCDDPYGGCVKQYTWVDTLHEVGGLWSWKDKAVSKVSNHYAAMPSMHAGYSLWCSMSMYGHASHAVLRGLAVVYPILTLYCIVVTANHYFMDAIIGSCVFWVATKVAAFVPRVGRGANDEVEDMVTDAEERIGLLPISVQAVEVVPVKSPSNHNLLSNAKLSPVPDIENGQDNSPKVKALHITKFSLQKR